jgi:hypothetical protein
MGAVDHREHIQKVHDRPACVYDRIRCEYHAENSTVRILIEPVTVSSRYIPARRFCRRVFTLAVVFIP